jgi:hypothetical protein
VRPDRLAHTLAPCRCIEQIAQAEQSAQRNARPAAAAGLPRSDLVCTEFESVRVGSIAALAARVLPCTLGCRRTSIRAVRRRRRMSGRSRSGLHDESPLRRSVLRPVVLRARARQGYFRIMRISVLRAMPSMRAARLWLPPHASSAVLTRSDSAASGEPSGGTTPRRSAATSYGAP